MWHKSICRFIGAITLGIVGGASISVVVLGFSIGWGATLRTIIQGPEMVWSAVESLMPSWIVDGPSAEEYMVYEAIFSELGPDSWYSGASKKKPLVIASEAVWPGEYRSFVLDEASLADCFTQDAVDIRAIEDLVNKSRERSIIRHRLQLSVPYRLVPLSRAKKLVFDHTGTYVSFYPEISRLITLSRVGFSSDGSLAVIYVEDHCPLCGIGGRYFALRTNGTGWQIVDGCITWES